MVQNGAIFRARIGIGDRIRNKRSLTQKHPAPAIHSDFIQELYKMLWTVCTNSQESGWDMLCDGRDPIDIVFVSRWPRWEMV